MILLPHMKGKRIAVFGLGRTGLSAVRSLGASGAHVVAWDDAEEARDKLLKETSDVATYPSGWRWEDMDALVLSPGIPLTHPTPHQVVDMARQADVPIISDIELFVQSLGEKGNREARVIAVTGTNGKSTTVALIGHLLTRAGFAPQVGGNIGKPVLELDAPGPKSIYVLEISSYQADLTPSLAPEVAVLLNISPDHLERHGGLEGYAASKAKIFHGQQTDDKAIISIDDKMSAGICADLKLRHRHGRGAKVIPLTVGRSLGKGVFVAGSHLVDAASDPAIEIADLAQAPALRGGHNWQNAAAAYAAARAMGADIAALSEALLSFPGLEHRQEAVASIEGVLFVNDSKATNTVAAAKALGAFKNVFWIAGGRAKEGGLGALEAALSNAAKAYLIGEAAEAFESALKDKLECVVSGTLDRAVAAAYADARSSGLENPVVVLSPACSSFDQFTDFEARGAAFRKLVEDLGEEALEERAAQ